MSFSRGVSVRGGFCPFPDHPERQRLLQKVSCLLPLTHVQETCLQETYANRLAQETGTSEFDMFACEGVFSALEVIFVMRCAI